MIPFKYWVVALLFAIPCTGYTQSIWLSGSQAPNQLSIEWAKPRFERQFDRDKNISLFSSTLFISGMFKLNDHLDFVADIPLSHWQYRDDDGPDNQKPHTTIGNVYLGSVYTSSNVPVFFTPSIEVGIRIPTMSDPDFPGEDFPIGNTMAIRVPTIKMNCTLPTVRNCISQRKRSAGTSA